MAVKYRTEKKENLIVVYSIYFVLAIVISLLQTGLFNFIAISEITPDLIIVLVVWVSINRGQFIGLFAGFVFGLIFDIVSMDVIGTNALSKTLAAYIAGFFFKEGKLMTADIRFIVAVAFSSLINNLVYYFFYLKVSEMSYLTFFLQYGLGSAAYTTIISIPAFLVARTGK